jgi:uncharacterized small protein (DUF1192 family)
MRSAQKIQANRKNALASSGPKTANGRIRSARNPLRHALSLSVYSYPELSEEIATLAREIAGPAANAEIQELARHVAEAQIDLRRVRYARHQLLCDALANPNFESRADSRAKMRLLKQFLTPKLVDIPLPVIVEKFLTTTPEGPAKFATILSEETRQLLAMDRYERRALSRRKFAIRAFDEALRR